MCKTEQIKWQYNCWTGNDIGFYRDIQITRMENSKIYSVWFPKKDSNERERNVYFSLRLAKKDIDEYLEGME